MSFDNQQDNKAFAEKYAFNFPLLCDTDRSMGVAYGAVDPGVKDHARRIGVVVGPDGKIVAYESKVQAGEYPTEVLQQL